MKLDGRSYVPPTLPTTLFPFNPAGQLTAVDRLPVQFLPWLTGVERLLRSHRPSCSAVPVRWRSGPRRGSKPVHTASVRRPSSYRCPLTSIERRSAFGRSVDWTLDHRVDSPWTDGLSAGRTARSHVPRLSSRCVSLYARFASFSPLSRPSRVLNRRPIPCTHLALEPAHSP